MKDEFAAHLKELRFPSNVPATDADKERIANESQSGMHGHAQAAIDKVRLAACWQLADVCPDGGRNAAQGQAVT